VERNFISDIHRRRNRILLLVYSVHRNSIHVTTKNCIKSSDANFMILKTDTIRDEIQRCDVYSELIGVNQLKLKAAFRLSPSNSSPMDCFFPNQKIMADVQKKLFVHMTSMRSVD